MMPPHNYLLTEFFIGCIFSNDPLDRQALPSAHCNADSVSPPQPPDIGYALQPQQRLAMLATVTRTPRPHACYHSRQPGLERYAHLCTTHGILVKAAPVRPRLCTSI